MQIDNPTIIGTLAGTSSFAQTASYVNMPYGQILPPAQTTANLNNTWADITSGSFTLTQAGTYEIIYNFTIGNSTSNWVAAGLFDSANTYLSGSGTLATSATNGVNLSSGVFVTITTPTAYKIRVKTYNTTAVTVYQSEPVAAASGGSILRWKKIT